MENIVFAVDLDDTLYKELDYRRSGLIEVSRWIELISGFCVADQLEYLLLSGCDDVLGGLCQYARLPKSFKESALWVYRLHYPKISLTFETTKALEKMKELGQVVVLSDGRSITQRQKLNALGLQELPVYISEDYESEKPELLRFERVMVDFPAEAYVYIGDNPRKDFIAPNALGWKTICIKDDGRNVHRQTGLDLTAGQMPNYWIDQLEDALNLIC